MPTNTYKPIASITLGSSASSVTFSSIPQDYRDLVLVIDGAQTTENPVAFELNDDAGGNYTGVWMAGNGSAVGSVNNIVNRFAYVSNDQARASAIVQFMDYSATNKHKTVLSRSNSIGYSVIAHAHRWANTSAITKIDLQPFSQFTATTTISLYGIEA